MDLDQFRHKYPCTQEEINANTWMETTEDEFHEALRAVPPILFASGCFLMGEPLTDLHTGEPVFMAFVSLFSRYYYRPETAHGWNTDRYKSEVVTEMQKANATP